MYANVPVLALYVCNACNTCNTCNTRENRYRMTRKCITSSTLNSRDVYMTIHKLLDTRTH